MTRKAFVLVAVLALCLSGTVAGSAVKAPLARSGPRTLTDVAKLVGDIYPLPVMPDGLTVEQRAHWVLEELNVNGRTPGGWLRWQREVFNLDAVAASPVTRGDLVGNVLRLYAAVGAPIVPSAVAGINLSAARMPSELVAPFGELVGVVADAYAAQLPIARDITARIRAFEPSGATLLKPAERDAMAVRQVAILDAIKAFRARTGEYFAGAESTDDPIFSDPEGLVILGGQGNGTYTRSGMFPDPVLLVDPSGNDLYLNSAGGACPVTPDNFFFGGVWLECNNLVLSVVADLGDDTTVSSDDTYSYDGVPAAVQGAGGPGAIGILVDVGGDDEYDATMTRGASPPFFMYFDGGAQGYGYAGNGLLLDGVGNDVYRFSIYSSVGYDIWAIAQGFGAAGGLGISSDLAGNDAWLVYGLGQAANLGFEGLYSMGVGFYGGVGLVSDTGLGNDVWTGENISMNVDYYAQGFGAFGGLGAMFDDGGDDDYFSLEEATEPGQVLNPLLNCAYGTASLGGVGVQLDLLGNDTYYGASISHFEGSSVMDSGFGGPGQAYGLFMDTGGDDRYEMVATALTPGQPEIIQGRGLYEPAFEGDILPIGYNTFGTFVDIGGTDTYIGGAGGNNSQWPFGIDRGA